ncbi:3593_t:CDS:2 [Rhizophagus irregularis]|nr:3593_t:CDS:2 [Rhizophagus irregularis]
MPPIFPSNYTYPRQGYIIPFPKNTHQEKYFIFDDNTIESIISTVITPDEQKEIESLTFLPLVDLVKPGIKKHKDNKAPRSQNVFVIFRKDQQARLTFEKGPSFTSQLKHVSIVVSKLWKEATAEQKTLYDRVSYITKQVHKHLWPDYSNSPPSQFQYRNSPPSQFQYRNSPPSQFQYRNSPPSQFQYRNSSPSQFQYRRTLPFPTNSPFFPQKYSYYQNSPQKYSYYQNSPQKYSYHQNFPQKYSYQNKVLPSPISSFSPNNTHLLEINPSNTMNEQYDKYIRNSLNKFSRLSL